MTGGFPERLTRLSLARAFHLLPVGLIGGPILYLIGFFVVDLGLATLAGNAVLPLLPLAFQVFMLPVICGVGSTLVAAAMLSREGSAPSAVP